MDIAVYLSNLNESSHKKLEILGKLNDLLGTDEIDLVLLNDASLPLIINILKNNKILVDKDPPLRHCYHSLNMRKYFDFHRFEAGILKRKYFDGR